MMKKLLSIAALLLVTRFQAQNVNACNNAQNICSNPNFLFQGISGSGLTSGLNVSNPTTNPQIGNGSNPTAPANSGCLLTNGPGPQWLILTVSVSGNLGFIFGDPSSPNPQVGLYDWMMWPFTPSTCVNIFNNTLPPVSCNWNATSSGGTGMGTVPSGGNVGNYQPSIPVVAGQQFLILISNYSGINSLVSFTSTGTASLTCGFNYAICKGNTATITPVGFVPLTNQSFTLQPLGLTNTNGTFVVTPSVTTTYTVYGSGLNSQSVQATQASTSNVVVNPQPTVAATATQMTCSNDSSAFNLGLTFNPSSPTPTYNINWSPIPNGLPNPTTTAFSGTFTPGAYSATVTAAGGCSAVANFSIAPKPAPAMVNLAPAGPVYSITCSQPVVTINALDPSFNYTWTNGIIAPVTAPTATFDFTGTGNWTVLAVNPTSSCVATKTIVIGQNTIAPVSVITPTYQTINCNLTSVQTVTLSSVSPTVNVTHNVLTCFGGSFTANSVNSIYQPGGPCTYTHVLINDVNGCKTVKEFTVYSSQVFPTYSVVSPQNYTLGCSTKSTAVISITSASVQGGGAISYTLIPPNTSSVTPPGPLSGISTYTVNAPGTYTTVAKDNVNLCETRVPVTVMSNTFGPTLDTLLIPRKVLDCFVPKTTLKGISSNTNTTYNWSFPDVPGNQAGDSITVFADFTARTATVIDNHTLTLTDQNNKCITTTVVTIYQNLFLPKAVIGGAGALSCKTSTIMLSNMSSTGIQGSFFPSSGPVSGYLWEGPSPQLPKQVSSNYLAEVIGVYTLTAMDMNNGCTSQTTAAIADDRVYPLVNKPNPPPIDCGSTAQLSVAVTTNSTGLSYEWIAPEGAVTSPKDKSTLTTDSPGNYRVVLTNTLNGCATGVDMKVGIGTLTANFVADVTSGYAPLTVTFSNTSASAQGTGSVTSLWNFSNGTSTLIAGNAPVSTVYKEPGTYTVVLYSRKGSCLDSAMKIITIEIPSSLTVPNVFTPNNDGVNDLFFLKTTNITEVSMQIYDRWGHKVYDLTSSTGNVAWDGNNQAGQAVSEGTYFYILKGTGKDGHVYESKGNISLFR